MLDKLLNDYEKWTYLLINDDDSVNGRALLFAFVKQYLERLYEVHYLTYDIFPNGIKEKFSSLNERFHYHDGCTDWKYSIKTSSEDKSTLTPESNIITYFNKIECKHENVLLVVDSISTLLIHQPADLICKYLYSIKLLWEQKGVNVKILSLIHSQIHDESILKTMEYLFSTIVWLQVNPENKNSLCCQINHRRANGKIIKEEEGFKIDNLKIIDVKRIDRQKIHIKSSPLEFDPTAGLSFKLTLDETEKAARDQLILPYTQVKSEQKKGLSEIIYEADVNDDFDEEDPDDDLNI